MNKIFLDAREMEHPEPLQISLSHLQSMTNEQYLYMINVRKPIPLLEIAKEKGFIYFIHQDSNEIWHILISKNSETLLEELLDV
jgi:CRISPR/Cas system-associated exonuclease Cas4 (RecB family)